MNLELIVPPNKETTKMGLIVCPFMTFAAFYFWYSCFALYPLVGNLLAQLIQSILMLIIILFSIGFIYGLVMQKNNDPVARLTPEGIWVKDYGFIPWPEIIELSEYQFPGTPMVGIGIRVNDLKR